MFSAIQIVKAHFVIHPSRNRGTQCLLILRCSRSLQLRRLGRHHAMDRHADRVFESLMALHNLLYYQVDESDSMILFDEEMTQTIIT